MSGAVDGWLSGRWHIVSGVGMSTHGCRRRSGVYPFLSAEVRRTPENKGRTAFCEVDFQPYCCSSMGPYGASNMVLWRRQLAWLHSRTPIQCTSESQTMQVQKLNHASFGVQPCKFRSQAMQVCGDIRGFSACHLGESFKNWDKRVLEFTHFLSAEMYRIPENKG